MDQNISILPNGSLTSILSSPPPLLGSVLPTSPPAFVPAVVSNTASTTVGALILSLVFLLGVPGNLFIIWSILARSRKQSVTTLLILHLALADGSLMALTPFFIVYLVKRTWVFGSIMCKVLFYLCLANMYASIHLITLMSLHRLVAILWPQRLSTVASRGRVLRALAVLWLLVMAASIPALLFREQKRALDEEHRKVCESFHEKQSFVILQYTMELVLGFVIPYTLIVASYICILRRIRQTKFQRRIRSEKLILAIVVTFCVFWMPYHIINMVQVAAALCPEDSQIKQRLDHIGKSCRAITSALAFISSCANPVLYTFAGKSYIRRDGLAFMARLFEGTALDYVARKSLQNSQSSREKEKEANGVMLKDRDPESTTSVNGCLTGKPGKSDA